MLSINFVKLYETSFKENWDLNALTDLNENTNYTYGEVAKEIARMHILFEEMGVKNDDKIALIGPNHSSWVIVFMATITYGAVIVPILQNFHPQSIENIINHSDAKIVFIENSIWKLMNEKNIPHPVFSLKSFTSIKGECDNIKNLNESINNIFKRKYPNGYFVKDVTYKTVPNDAVICLNYTSGTLGFIKGVMLTANSYAGNIIAARPFNPIFKREKNVCFLPLAHVFSCMSDLLYPLSVGAHIHLVAKIKNSQMLFDFFKAIKPNHITTVPFILEIIYHKLMREISMKSSLKLFLKIPVLNKIIYRKMRNSLISDFGGNYRELVVGGASLNEKVEDFLYKIKFPFSVGYGMTECGPLISYSNHKHYVPRSCGKVVEPIMNARIDSVNPQYIAGEIQVKGELVMKGYYKDSRATAVAFTEDGWLRTGDLGTIDKKGRLYIKGLLKDMILGSNGQNIYPKEIEARLNKMDFVSESLVIKRNSGMVAMVYPDYPKIKKMNLSLSDLETIMKNNRKELNKMIARYERIGKIEIMKNQFEKTTDNVIKREMYV